jgi:two-component system, response regulator, stage 0 sporulation protein F
MIKILYVDDEVINIDLFKLTFLGKYDIHTALSGEEGLHILQKDDTFDLIISDMKMPGMNGLEFIRQVKKTNRQIPCIVLSGYAKSTEADKAIENQLIESYFTKPFNKKLLEKEIENCTKQ